MLRKVLLLGISLLLGTTLLSPQADGRIRVPFRRIPPSIKATQNTTTGIPVICVNTFDGKAVVSRDSYVECTVNVSNVPGKKALYDVPCSIRLRGNSSSYYGQVAKILANPVPYRLKFDDKVNLLGLNGGAKCRNWILLTNLKMEMDVLKNDIALRMGRMILGPEKGFCSDAQLAHLYLNGVFQGAYLVCEQNQVNKHRVDVLEPEKDYPGTDIGYFLEIDRYAEQPAFTMD